MNIDMAALHAIEADKGISVDVVVDTIKTALLTAYRHTDGHEPDAIERDLAGTSLAGNDHAVTPARSPAR